MKRLKTQDLAKKLEGTHSLSSIIDMLKVSRQKAVYYIFRMRKKGYVKTTKDRDNKRIYNISQENRLGGKSYADIINQNSLVKIYPLQDYKIYGKIEVEEALAYAIKSKDLRTILASLPLFNKIKKWKLFYELAKKYNIKNQIGALYDVARLLIRTRKMPEKYKKNLLPKKDEKYRFIIDKLKSDDFKDIEKKWRVYLPFNKADLEEYKR